MSSLAITLLPDVALAQASIFDLVVGRWWDKTTQTDVIISKNKRVSSCFWKGLTGSVTETSKSGSNFGFFNEERECYYLINILGDGSRSNWRLVESIPKGSCPPGGEYEQLPDPEEILRRKKEEEVARQALKDQTEALIIAQTKARLAAEATAAAAERAKIAAEAKAVAAERSRIAAEDKEKAEIEAQKAADDKAKAEKDAADAANKKERAAQDLRNKQKKLSEEDKPFVDDQEEEVRPPPRYPTHRVTNLCSYTLKIWFSYSTYGKWHTRFATIPGSSEQLLPNSYGGEARFPNPWFFHAEAGPHQFGTGYVMDVSGVKTSAGKQESNNISFKCSRNDQ